ncbi:tetratricopeptide repeat protein [Nitrospira calida]
MPRRTTPGFMASPSVPVTLLVVLSALSALHGPAFAQTAQSRPTTSEPVPNRPAPSVLDQTRTISDLRETVRRQPELAETRFALASALYGAGEFEGAIDEYRALLRLQPDHMQARFNLAVALMAKQQWREAVAELREFLRLAPDSAQAQYNLGNAYFALKNWPAAIEAYSYALKLNPDYPDAHYRLGLTLKQAKRDSEAVDELLLAARDGIAKAQYLLGNAFQSGQGVKKSWARAIGWWFLAAEQGVEEANAALARLRRLAMEKGSRNAKDATAAAQAFEDFRADLWLDFPDLAPSTDGEGVGATLLKQGRVQDAVPVLIREAYALGEVSHYLLERLYEEGVEGRLAPYDPRILRYLETTAAEGLPHSRLALARIYAKGLGVPRDHARVKTLLKGLPKEEAQLIIESLSSTPQNQ